MKLHALPLGLLVMTALVPAAALFGCDGGCPAGETEEDVIGGRGGYVCAPSPQPPATAAPTPTQSPAASGTASGTASPAPSFPYDASAPPPSGCTTQSAGTLDVAVVPESGTAPTLVDTPIANGTYFLVQTSAYGPGASAPSLPILRATIIVTGNEILFGTQTSEQPATNPNESFTTTLAADTLTLVCASRTGPVGAALFPSTAGATEPAQIVQDATTRIVTLRLVVQGTDFDLVFEPQ